MLAKFSKPVRIMKLPSLLFTLALLLCGSPLPVSAQALKPATAATDPIVGRWKVGKNVWNIHADGTVVRSRPNFREKGSWTRNAAGKYDFSWSNGRETDSLRLENDKLVDRNKKGQSVDRGARITD